MSTLIKDPRPVARPGEAAARFPLATSGPARVRQGAGSGGGVRLTARGRRVATILGVAVGLVTAFSAQSAHAGAPGGAVAVRTWTVAAGETLWEIAGEVARPGEDVRDVIAELRDLNDLPDSGVAAGEQILVPVR